MTQVAYLIIVTISVSLIVIPILTIKRKSSKRNHHTQESHFFGDGAKVNPATGLPMRGIFDLGGNLYLHPFDDG